jgi:GT2 family glycosyltransferase
VSIDATIAVATFGDSSWADLAQARAIPSAEALGVPVVHVHDETLHDARNAALDLVGTEWVVHLDADDELEPGYLDHMACGTADLRAPAVRYVRGPRQHTPYVPKVAGHTHDCTGDCIASGAGNWLVVGTMARTQLLRDIGGWRDWPMYEDFDLWMRALLTGATVEAIPSAVYRAFARPDSRNRGPSMVEKNRVHYAIVAANLQGAAAA